MSNAFLRERSLGRIMSGHPWVYASDILRTDGGVEDGAEVTVRSAQGVLVGTGFANSKSKIPVRIFSRKAEELDKVFFRRRILAARDWRRSAVVSSGLPLAADGLPEGCRLFWSEADFLPGLIVDRYGDALVIQTLTLGLDQRREILLDLLQEIFQPSLMVERNDAPSRQFEGLPPRKGIVRGEGSPVREVRLGWIKLEVDLLEGHKTASYLDQVENHVRIGELAKGLRVLDCFSYQGGFALHAAKGGAARVEAVDLSETALATARRNGERNALPDVEWKTANVFDDLNARLRAKENFDLVVLDPPSFTRTRERLPEALRGYKEIHLKALRLLGPGGLLATFCCSHHVSAETFRAVALDAAFDAHRTLRLVRAFPQAADHPIIPAIPETEYLKGFLFQVVE